MKKNRDKQLQEHISNYNLQSRDDLKEFIIRNPQSLLLNDLSRIAELVNNRRSETSAYYTDEETLNLIYENLPEFNKKVVRILEPSVGVGNFLEIIFKKYSHIDAVEIDVVDIDKKSIEICQLLNEYRDVPSNIKINYIISDYLLDNQEKNYDLIVGNPPFSKLTKNTPTDVYRNVFNDTISKNLSSFFLQKSLKYGENVIMILPKYFLSNSDFDRVREIAKKYSIEKIIDFGEKGFKGVLIETIAIFINTKNEIGITTSHSITKNIVNIQMQDKLTDDKFPNWLLYRNEFFEDVSSKIIMDTFSVYRDRSITNSKLNESSGVRVLKSRNIRRDGQKILDIDGYDRYIDESILQTLDVNKYRYRTDVFLSPNMTYYPRIIKKPNNCVVNGSIAILELKEEFKMSQHHIDFINSETFEEFYKIARNYSTRSLNIDKNSVKYFGLLRTEI